MLQVCLVRLRVRHFQERPLTPSCTPYAFPPILCSLNSPYHRRLVVQRGADQESICEMVFQLLNALAAMRPWDGTMVFLCLHFGAAL
jgi:hypothetical protein